MGELQLTRRAALAAAGVGGGVGGREGAAAPLGDVRFREIQVDVSPLRAKDEDDSARLGRGGAAGLSQADLRQVSRAGRPQRRRPGGAHRRRHARRRRVLACRSAPQQRHDRRHRRRRRRRSTGAAGVVGSYPLYSSLGADSLPNSPYQSDIRAPPRRDARAQLRPMAAGQDGTVSRNAGCADWRGRARPCAWARAKRVTRSTRSASPRRSGASYEMRRVEPRAPFVWMSPFGPVDPRDRGAVAAAAARYRASPAAASPCPICARFKRAGGARVFAVFLQDPRFRPRVDGPDLGSRARSPSRPQCHRDADLAASVLAAPARRGARRAGRAAGGIADAALRDRARRPERRAAFHRRATWRG